ncbi:hypothetical protein CYME_CMF067C [Cyanidioschyzon merolae strain 10D]|uniref:Uncharacterized protein n=1 Tax=Cyanidioschyzon merolae (strain NIES-3377 / 10D) TaxID=280699 RepID=M1VFU2_CYAM1|nr:hypothetical protein CYME_CMF067C [Cyanidioschyzon merolae strain 10D]BAM79448.1 hypothetical protein CYME_CMF067C [Cyanidioschyzon merolae strain 10D]|eukprot:XP_005535734.1 hypothetical protein CYME_CMF067C [Cyanidioschyzon merolae strain 10D]
MDTAGKQDIAASVGPKRRCIDAQRIFSGASVSRDAWRAQRDTEGGCTSAEDDALGSVCSLSIADRKRSLSETRGCWRRSPRDSASTCFCMRLAPPRIHSDDKCSQAAWYPQARWI